MEYVGIDWSYRRAAWCALSGAGAIVGEGAVSSDDDGLARLVIKRGTEVRAVVEMMSGAIWVRDTFVTAGWEVQIAHARKVRDVAPLEVVHLGERRVADGLLDAAAQLGARHRQSVDRTVQVARSGAALVGVLLCMECHEEGLPAGH